MSPREQPRVESEAARAFTRVMTPGDLRRWPPSAPEETQAPRMNLDRDNVKNGLGRLVLTLVKLLHELLERQAIRRIEAGHLSEAEIERLGVTLMEQAREIDRLRKQFDLKEDDLNLDLGPLGRLF